jgi:5-methylcytosine-specific restriction endonuclease McrA
MIDTTGMPFQKPAAAEGKLTLSPAQRKLRLDALCRAQGGLCAICGRRMTREYGYLRTATLDHIKPQPAGCAKDDRPENHQAVCFECNAKKGSQRI